MDSTRHSPLATKAFEDGSLDNHPSAESDELGVAGESERWLTGIWKRLPYVGFAALFAVALRKCRMPGKGVYRGNNDSPPDSFLRLPASPLHISLLTHAHKHAS
jgi:hypothetical protein